MGSLVFEISGSFEEAKSLVENELTNLATEYGCYLAGPNSSSNPRYVLIGRDDSQEKNGFNALKEILESQQYQAKGVKIISAESDEDALKEAEKIFNSLPG